MKPSDARRLMRDLHRAFDETAPGYMRLEERAKAILGHLADVAGAGEGNGNANGNGGGNGGEQSGQQRAPTSGARGGAGKTPPAATRREARGLRFGQSGNAGGGSPRASGNPNPNPKPGGGGDAAELEAIKRFIAKLVG